jgi:hypothetical protein
MSKSISARCVLFYNVKYFFTHYLPYLVLLTVLAKLDSSSMGNAGLQTIQHIATCFMFLIAFNVSRHKDFILALATPFITGQFIMTFDRPHADVFGLICFLIGVCVLSAKFYIYRYDNVRLATRGAIVPTEIKV